MLLTEAIRKCIIAKRIHTLTHTHTTFSQIHILYIRMYTFRKYHHRPFKSGNVRCTSLYYRYLRQFTFYDKTFNFSIIMLEVEGAPHLAVTVEQTFMQTSDTLNGYVFMCVCVCASVWVRMNKWKPTMSMGKRISASEEVTSMNTENIHKVDHDVLYRVFNCQTQCVSFAFAVFAFFLILFPQRFTFK